MNLSPGVPNTHAPTTTKFGKFSPVPIEKLSNDRASASLTTRTLPPSLPGIGRIMDSLFPGSTKISKGGYGSVYSLKNVQHLGEKMRALYGSMDNRITVTPQIPSGKHLVVKIMVPHPDDAKVWKVSAAKQEAMYIKAVTRRTLERNGAPRTREAYTKQLEHTADNFLKKPDAFQKSQIQRHMDTLKHHVWDEFLHVSALDAANHAYLMTAPVNTVSVVDLTNNSEQRETDLRFDPRDVVPTFYFAGSLRPYGAYIIVMDFVMGKPIKSREKMTPLMTASLEKALLTLAAAGMDHGDAHLGNFFYHQSTGVKIIDFGMSAILPKRFRSHATTAAIDAVTSLCASGKWPRDVVNAVWSNARHGITRYMNTYMHSKYSNKFEWYNPTGKLLRFVLARFSKDSMNSARRIVWGSVCKKKKIPPRKTPPKKKTPTPRKKTTTPTQRIRIFQEPKRPMYDLNYGNL